MNPTLVLKYSTRMGHPQQRRAKDGPPAWVLPLSFQVNVVEEKTLNVYGLMTQRISPRVTKLHITPSDLDLAEKLSGT